MYTAASAATSSILNCWCFAASCVSQALLTDHSYNENE